MNMTLSDTLSRVTRSLPLITEQKKITMYVCGVTPYDVSHIGHGRVYVTFDLLYRVLLFLGYDVAYCRNFTDVDDKLIAKAIEQYGDPQKYLQLANTYIQAFKQDMALLNCLEPTVQPRVTENIESIIAFIAKLIQEGYAYEVEGDVYFHVPAYKDYAQLSKHKLEDLKAGARVEQSDKKKHPLDFALWKHEPERAFWQSPWGNGRPGWHIECSAMAREYLSDSIDIHGGGMDLIFPHHENELAQTQSITGKPFAKIWVHVALVRIEKEKMSKSLGNFFTLRDVFKTFDPMVVRYYYLTHHYRSPLDFSFKDLKVAEKTYQRLCKLFAHVSCKSHVSTEGLMHVPIVKDFVAALTNDLNTPAMFGMLFSALESIIAHNKTACAVKQFLQHVLGLSMVPLPEKEVDITPEIQKLINEREQARKQKDWHKADQLRDKLKQLGFAVKDKKLP